MRQRFGPPAPGEIENPAVPRSGGTEVPPDGMSREEWLAEMSKDHSNIEDRRGFRDVRGETEFAEGDKPFTHVYNWGMPDRTSYEAAQYHAQKAPDDPDAQKLASDARFAKMVNELKKKRSIMVTR